MYCLFKKTEVTRDKRKKFKIPEIQKFTKDCTGPQGPGPDTTKTCGTMKTIRMREAKTHAEKEVIIAERAGRKGPGNPHRQGELELEFLDFDVWKTEGRNRSAQRHEHAAAWRWGLGLLGAGVVWGVLSTEKQVVRAREHGCDVRPPVGFLSGFEFLKITAVVL